MPGLNGMGPSGFGKGYGKGLGRCFGFPYAANAAFGFGRRFGPGYRGIMPVINFTNWRDFNTAPMDEKNLLAQQKEFLTQNLDAVNKRLEEINK